MFAIRLRLGPPAVHRLRPSQCGIRAISKSSFPPKLSSLETQEEMDRARSWIKSFESQQITRDNVELSFARSSGPGGQNVNKVNTKAIVRCSLYEDWIPAWARDALKNTPSYVSSSQSILVTSTASRSQAQNVDDCLRKLHALVLSASFAAVVNEPTEEQKQRVRKLQRAENARRRSEKEKRSTTKQGRSSKGSWD